MDDQHQPQKIGPGMWAGIHIPATKATTADTKIYFIWLAGVYAHSFPCQHCRTHFLEYLRLHPIENYLNIVDSKGRDIGMYRWSWEFHNSVNRRIGKPEVPFTVSYDYWSGMESTPCKACRAEDLETIRERVNSRPERSDRSSLGRSIGYPWI